MIGSVAISNMPIGDSDVFIIVVVNGNIDAEDIDSEEIDSVDIDAESI